MNNNHEQTYQQWAHERAEMMLPPKAIGALESSLVILREFVTDVEAIGTRSATMRDWPDLYITFSKAKKLLTEINAIK